MTRPMAEPEPLVLPPEPDQDKLPKHVDKRQLAQIHNQYYGPISHRSLETWPLEWRLVNGRGVTETGAALAEARRRFNAGRVIRGRQRQTASAV